ncbi:MAG: AI-2E family transporter [Pseudanabaenales cyanobacterium]|nr:AI-2E family transporter [Pseudanabaenales cyanobacterium]
MREPSVPAIWERLNTLALLRFLLLFACGWAITQLLAYFEVVVVVFVSSAILAFLLSYPVQWLNRFLPHGIAVFVIFLFGLVLIGGIAATVGIAVLSQGERLTEAMAEFLHSLAPLVERLEATLHTWNLSVDLRSIETQIRQQALELMGAGLAILQAALANVIHAILIAVVTFFMLLDGARIWHFSLKLIPTHLRQRFTVTVQHNLLGFFWGRLLLSIFFAVSAFVTFLILKAPFALVLAVIVGLFDLIPGIGATLGITLVALFLLSQSVWLSLTVIVTCVLLQQIEENILLPRIMQDSLDINPVVMFFALLVGARVAGLLGVFLSIPVAGVIVSLLEIQEMKGHSTRPELQDLSPVGETLE